jgi:hypothetical protein
MRMGWKALKEAFGISHAVQVSPQGICIGSGYASDIVTIDTQTGVIQESEAFSGFLRQHYPTLREASPEEILKLIETPDTFSAAIPVYTYEGGDIVEKMCEATGWPNVTHDGCMMYENIFSTDKAKVIAWAKRNAESAMVSMREHIAKIENDLTKSQDALAGYESNRIRLEEAYPGQSSEQILQEYKFRQKYPTLAKMVDMLLEKHNVSGPQVFQKISPGRSDLFYFGETEEYCAKQTAWDLEALCFGREGCCDKRGVDVDYEDDCVIGVPHEVYPVIESIRNSIEKLSRK